MTDHDLIQEARKPRRYGKLTRELADALEAAVARGDQLEKALREIEPALTGNAYLIARAALAGVPAEPAAGEKCPNGPDEYGNWPCDRGADDVCTVCGWEPAASSVSAGAGQVPADTIEKALALETVYRILVYAPGQGATPEQAVATALAYIERHFPALAAVSAERAALAEADCLMQKPLRRVD